jgi:hypothetical protein
VPAPDLVPAAGALFGYGPGPGMELIPYFLALLAWAGLAILSIFLSPFRAVWRRIRGTRQAATAELVPVSEPAAPAAPEPAGEGAPDRA